MRPKKLESCFRELKLQHKLDLYWLQSSKLKPYIQGSIFSFLVDCIFLVSQFGPKFLGLSLIKAGLQNARLCPFQKSTLLPKNITLFCANYSSGVPLS